jgi:hypothetical protein
MPVGKGRIEAYAPKDEMTDNEALERLVAGYYQGSGSIPKATETRASPKQAGLENQVRLSSRFTLWRRSLVQQRHRQAGQQRCLPLQYPRT